MRSISASTAALGISTRTVLRVSLTSTNSVFIGVIDLLLDGSPHAAAPLFRCGGHFAWLTRPQLAPVQNERLGLAQPSLASVERAKAGAKGGTRTPIAFRLPDPKSGASANSATFAAP